MTSDNPAQQERLARLDTAKQAWLASALDPVIAMRRAVAQGMAAIEPVLALEKEGRGKQGMDAMRALLGEIGQAETTLRAQRSEAAAALQAGTHALDSAGWRRAGADTGRPDRLVAGA